VRDVQTLVLARFGIDLDRRLISVVQIGPDRLRTDQERPVQFVVTGALPCDVNIRADYEALTATLELINVRRFGRFTVRLDTASFKAAIDDMARYALGVDDDFEMLIPNA